MLKITKKGDKYWLFEDSEIGLFSPSKFTINLLNNVITIVYENGLKSKNYNVIDCEIYDLGATSPFTTSSGDLFMQKLEELNCPCFQKNENIFNISGGAWGDITGNLSNQNDLQTALDYKLDKDTTAGVERAYIINADGSQGTKATSEFKDVLEFADFDAFPTTGETGKIYLAIDTNKTYRWSGSVYIELGGGANKQIFHWWGGNWTTTNLNQYYYISYNARTIETLPGGTGTTITASMTGRNQGLFIAPFNCKIKRVMFKEGASGSYTGAFVLASGLPNYNGTWNMGYTNTVTHLNQAITSAGYNQNKFEFLVTDNITVPKGYAVCPMLVFSAQAQAGKISIEISIEIEEVV